MEIAVIGMGYVGISNALMFANKHKVNVFDIDDAKLSQIEKGNSPIKDAEIQDALKSNLDNINVCKTLDETCKNVDFVLIAISSNYNSSIDSIDTTHIDKLITEILKLNMNCKIVIKSTVYVGFINDMSKKHECNKIYYSPEFLREGNAYTDCLNTNRIVVGVSDLNKDDDFPEFYCNLVGELCNTKPEKFIIKSSEGEAAKLFANAYLAMRVSFFNELDSFAESLNLDPKNIIDVVSKDERIGNYYNNPSFGFGGYCLPKDTQQLANEMDREFPQSSLIQSINISNKNRWKFVVDKILEFAKTKSNSENLTIGIYKLAMKTGSDNFRDSSMLHIIELLKLNNCKIIIYEDLLHNEDKVLDCKICNDIEEFKSTCDVIVANRYLKDLDSVKEKVYSRDIFHNN